jgi:hypothetical protein
MTMLRVTMMAGLIAAGCPAPAIAAPTAETVAAPTAPPALDPARVAAGRELIAVVLPPEKRNQMMESVLNAMLRNMVAGAEQGTGLAQQLAADDAKRAVFERFVERQRLLALADIKQALPGLIEAFAHAYARIFTVDEMSQIKAFAATPAGAKFLQRGPDRRADPDVGAWQRVLTAKGAARQEAEIARLRTEIAGAGKATTS